VAGADAPVVQGRVARIAGLSGVTVTLRAPKDGDASVGPTPDLEEERNPFVVAKLA